MKAALLEAFGKIGISEVEKPQVEPADVLVQIKACGLCATDVKKYTGASKPPQFPFILGHEAAGVVVEKGSGVEEEIRIGDRVVVAPVITCGLCFACRSGLTSAQGMGMCTNYRVIGHSIDGAFAEYLAVPARNIYRIPDNLSFEHAALVEPVAACANGVLRTLSMPPGTIVVVGAGFMGLVTVQLLKLLGSRVIVTELVEERLKLAADLGADLLVRADEEDVVQVVKEHTSEGRGADGVICTVGEKSVTEQGLDMLARGGCLVLMASGPHGTNFEVELNKLHYDQATITGSVSYTDHTFAWAIELLSRGQINAESLITHVGPLTDLPDFFALTRDMKGLKKVVVS